MKRFDELDKAGVVCSVSLSSETSHVIPIDLVIDGEEYFILYTPGFKDSRGFVFVILNGYRLWKAFQGAKAVYPVFVLKNSEKIGNSSSATNFQTYSDIVLVNKKNLSKCSFVMTRLKASPRMRENLAKEYRLAPSRESCTNESASVFCEVFAEKLSRPINMDNNTDGEAFILDLER